MLIEKVPGKCIGRGRGGDYVRLKRRISHKNLGVEIVARARFLLLPEKTISGGTGTIKDAPPQSVLLLVALNKEGGGRRPYDAEWKLCYAAIKSLPERGRRWKREGAPENQSIRSLIVMLKARWRTGFRNEGELWIMMEKKGGASQTP